MRRGRPRHDDILTPREWDVLQLLRDGLTNEQIAARLDISLSGAKYHVSEILSKLSVSSREEAARWSERQGPRRTVSALPLLLLTKKVTIFKIGLGVAGSAALGGFVLLFALALASREPEPAAVAPGPLGRVAFVREGNIWARDVDGGPERQITDGGNDLRPTWSWSGAWLTFQRAAPEPGTRVIRADGSGVRHLDAQGLVAWSPVDDVLAYFLADGSLVTEGPDGSGRVVVLGPLADGGVRDKRLEPAWSDDGQWVAFQELRWATATQPLPTFSYAGIRAVRADGSGEHEVFGVPNAPGDMTLAHWASHGAEALIWVSPVNSASIRADGIGLNLVTQMIRPTDVRSGLRTLVYEDYVDISPNAQWAAIAAGGGRESWAGKTIVRMDLATGATETLTDAAAAISPAWSPDGSHLAYVSGPDIGRVGGGNPARDGLSQRRIWTMSDDGGDKRPLTTDASLREEHPDWSNDGATVLFARIGQEGDAASLWTVPSAGGAATLVAEGLSFPAASPGGAELWFGYYGHVDWDLLYDWWQPAPDIGR